MCLIISLGSPNRARVYRAPDLTTCEFPKCKIPDSMEPDWTNTALRLSFSASLLYRLGHFFFPLDGYITIGDKASGTWKVAGLHLDTS